MEGSMYMEKVIGLLLLELLVMIVFTIIQLHKINRIGKKITSIVNTVEDYLAVVMEEENTSVGETASFSGEAVTNSVQNYEKEHETEVQSHLISAVLQEIFP
jgi:hypothetical protein